MSKFCAKCGSPIGDDGKCPKCDVMPTKQDLKAQKKSAKKQAKKDKKSEKRAQLTKNQKVKRFFLKSFAVLLALIIAVSGILFALVYFDVIDFPQKVYNLFENAPEGIELTDMTDEKADDQYGLIYYTPVDEKHVAGDNYTKYADNEILIVTKEGTTEEQVVSIAKKYVAEIVGEIQISGDYQIKFDNSYSKDELNRIADEIEKEEIVESASLNYIQSVSINAKTEKRNDFYFGEKWQGDLQNFNDVKGKSWGLEAIETLAAWDWLTSHSKSIKPVNIGLIDSGFDIAHEDLNFAEVFYNGENEVFSDSLKHGTHVAGIMAADNSSTTGVCGVYSYGSGRLYGVANVSVYSENGTFWSSVMGQKISYAELIVRNVKVINQSQGFNWYLCEPFAKYTKNGDLINIDYNTFNEWYSTSDFSDMENTAKDLGNFFNRMLKKGYDFVIVSAAGNDSNSSIGHIDCTHASWNNMISQEDYPDVFDRIIVVGAVDYKLNIAEYSNGGERVDIYAPGGNGGVGNKKVYSTLPNNKYGKEAGTSMAAPHVAGVAAMAWSINNDLTGAQIKEIIRENYSLRCSSCNMIDAYTAVQQAYNTKGARTTSSIENGAIFCFVVDRENEDIKISGAKVTAKNIQTEKEYNAITDSTGHFELAVPQGTYELTVTVDGYNSYTWSSKSSGSQKSITVKSGEVNYLDDWIKMTSIKNTLLEELKSKTDKPIIHFYYDDYDSNGKYEAFGVAGDVYDSSMGIDWYTDADVWFVSENKIECVKSGIYGFSNGVLKDEKYSFLSLEKSAGGSGSTSYVFGVKDGIPHEMNVSEKYGDFKTDENHIFKGYVSDFSAGYHQWIYTDFLFDSTSFEFVENTS